MAKYSRRQWITLLGFCIADFFSAACVSLQAPFYPIEAAHKGATASEYGLVFGVFELVVFIISPVYGTFIKNIGHKRMFTCGIFTTSTCCVLFGLLHLIEDHYMFIGMSLAIRVFEALGNAAFLTACFSIIAAEFTANMATAFASLETFFGIGMIVGPSIGGCLYELGGYMLPFFVLGGALFIAAITTCFILPSIVIISDNENTANFINILKIPSCIIGALTIAAAAIGIGFLQASLAPFLTQFNLGPITMGLMFVLNGGMYAISAPAWGMMVDHKFDTRRCILAATLMVILAFLLVGPAPFFHLPSYLILSIIALLAHGIGIGGQLVSSFAYCQHSAINDGFPDDLKTYGLVSSLWTSAFALGAFIGPTIAGVLYDKVGFPSATLVVVGLNCFVAVVVTGAILHKRLVSIRTNPKNESVVVVDERARLTTYAEMSYGSHLVT